MRKSGPLFRREQAAKVAFDLGGILMPGQPQAVSQPPAMSIDGNAGRLEGMTQYYIGRLPSHTGESGQLLHCGWHFAAEFLDQLPGTTLQRSCLGAEKS